MRNARYIVESMVICLIVAAFFVIVAVGLVAAGIDATPAYSAAVGLTITALGRALDAREATRSKQG